MAVSAYMTIKGITGPSTSKSGAIDILSFSGGVSVASTYGVGASGNEAKSGRPDFSQISVMKVTDKASPFLFQYCVKANVISSVVIEYTKPVSGKQQTYFKVTLGDALITSFQVAGSTEHPSESISFAYQAIEYGYAAEKDDGTLDSMVPKGYTGANLDDWAAPA
jgi:type VI secretion system secreted protein Hcp